MCEPVLSSFAQMDFEMLLSPCKGSNSGTVVSFYSRQAYFYCLKVSLGLAIADTLSQTPHPFLVQKHE